MRYQVPQFIEVEDKLFGPLTLKQFIYLAGGAGLAVVFYLLIKPLFLSFIFIAPVIGFACALAFLRINNRPFISVLESAFMFVINPKLYIWKHEQKPVAQAQKEEPALAVSQLSPSISNSKLKDLTWNLDTKGTATGKPSENE
jgi:cellulose synthase/poly-beta-1,6-N-acetylglucosamine synthase-like glycosyltransferase